MIPHDWDMNFEKLVGLPTVVVFKKINSLCPGRCDCNLKLIIFKHLSMTDILNISYEIALRWMPQELTDH